MAEVLSERMALVEKMLDCYARRDADGLQALLHKNAKHTTPGSDFGTDIVGGAAIADYFRTKVWTSFDRKTTFDRVHWWEDAARSVVILEWKSHVRPKTGKEYSNDGAFVVEIRDGLVYWVREYFDTERAHKNVNP